MEYLMLMVTLILVFLSFKDCGILPFPTGFIFLLATSQIVFTLHEEFNYGTFVMLNSINQGGLKRNYLVTHIAYTVIACLAYISISGYSNFSKNIEIAGKSLKNIANSKTINNALLILLILLTIHTALFLLITDWGLLWHSVGYLVPISDIQNSQLLGETVVGAVNRFQLLLVILSTIGLYAAFHFKKMLLFIPFFLINTFYFLFLFSQHSRSAIIIPLIFAAIHMAIGQHFRRTVLVFNLLISLFLIATALEGRGGYYAEQGFSTIPETISTFFTKDPIDSIGNIFINLSEGIFILAESLAVDKPFNTRYMLLAFSPFPSFIDGYSQIREFDEHRLHIFAPMSGIGEAINFGIPFVVLLLLYYFVTIRLHLRLTRHSPLMFIVCNFLILFSLYHILAYPIRNGLKYMWLCMLLSIIFMRPDGKNSSVDFPH